MLKETAEQAARREASAQAKLELMGKSKEEVEQKLDLERKRRKKAERKLKAAEDSLVRLNAVLIRSDSQLADDVKQDVNKLKSFFEARTNEIKEEAALTETLKHALSAKNPTTDRRLSKIFSVLSISDNTIPYII